MPGVRFGCSGVRGWLKEFVVRASTARANRERRALLKDLYHHSTKTSLSDPSWGFLDKANKVDQLKPQSPSD